MQQLENKLLIGNLYILAFSILYADCYLLYLPTPKTYSYVLEKPP
jgi:hypothetical protein